MRCTLIYQVGEAAVGRLEFREIFLYLDRKYKYKVKILSIYTKFTKYIY